MKITQFSVSHRHRQRGRTVGCALGLLGLLAAGIGLQSPAQAQPAGTALVDETFTGATADPEFEAFGPACLTGAPEAPAAPPNGVHGLTGCPSRGVGPTPPNDAAPHGYLRLTDASHDQSAAVLYNHALPANQGVVVTFDQWQYGATTTPPADGISFFLIDGAANLTAPGAFGGSLGYAQKLPDDNSSEEFLPGVNHGYIGVGLDVLGNYFGDWEHRGNGCERRSPAGTGFHIPGPGENMVTLRGPGNGTQGYCFLNATTSNFGTTGPWPSTLPGQLQGPTTSLPGGISPQEAEQRLEESRRTVRVEVSPSPNPVITVSVDFHDGHGMRQVLTQPAPQPVPSTYKFGFGASTGWFTDVHLLRNVSVHPAAELPQLNLVKQLPADPPVPQPLVPGQQVPYQYVVTNSGNTTLNDVTVTDDKVTGIICPRTSLASGESMTCTGVYAVTEGDAQAGQVRNTARATAHSDGTRVESPPDSLTLPTERLPGLRVEKNADTSHAYRVGDKVTYTYTVSNTGPTRLTGVGITDNRVRDIVCDTTELAPAGQAGDTTKCHGTYVVTDADADADQIVNRATAHGQSDGTQVTSPETELAVAVANSLSLGLEKTVDASRPYEVGARVTYHYRVTNTGDRPVTDLRIEDSHVTGVTCSSTSLAPDASTDCTGTYTVTQQDAERGNVSNQAGAVGRSGTREVESAPATARIDIVVPRPALAIDKSAVHTGPHRVGDEIEYTYRVTNTGNTPVTGIEVQDDRVTGVTCQETALQPRASTTCRGTYTVTDQDAQAGDIVNTATAHGRTPTGSAVQSPPDSERVQIARPRTGISVTKQVDTSRTYTVGDTVTYHYTVTNTGETPLSGIQVHDDHVAQVVCSDTILAPGGQTTCAGQYVVTEADARRGRVTNTAFATALNGTVRSDPATATIQVAEQPQPPRPPRPPRPPQPPQPPGPGKPCHGKPGQGPGQGKPEHGKPGHGKPGHGGRPGHDGNSWHDRDSWHDQGSAPDRHDRRGGGSDDACERPQARPRPEAPESFTPAMRQARS